MKKLMKNAIATMMLFALVFGVFQIIPKTKAIEVKSEEVGMGMGNPTKLEIVEVKPFEIKEVPLFNQCDYPNTPYGEFGTIDSHGCGITSVAMIASYYNNKTYSVPELAHRYGHYNTIKGSLWSIFQDSAKDLNIPFVGQTYDWNEVQKALENNQIVVSLQEEGLFTSGGHFIVLTKMENGRIFVNDPYGKNWDRNQTMIDGFANGFTIDQIRASEVTYWIYGKKA